MQFQQTYKELIKKKYHVFSFEDLCILYPQEKRQYLRQYLSRWKKQGWIGSLKRGLYELTYPEAGNIPDFFVANKMYAPSYVSLETALSYYSIIPEVSMSVTSVTAKTTRQFKNVHGLFIYRSVRPECFRGYTIENHQGFEILIAEPEKALADYLHFKSLSAQAFDKNAERIDMARVKRLSSRKIKSYAKLYNLDLQEMLYA
jgi:predicted transcriptional regulator of viral defense system